MTDYKFQPGSSKRKVKVRVAADQKDRSPSIKGGPADFMLRIADWKEKHPEHQRYTPKAILMIWIERKLVKK